MFLSGRIWGGEREDGLVQLLKFFLYLSPRVGRAGSAVTLRTRETRCDLIQSDAGARIIYLRRVCPVSSVLLPDSQLGKSLRGKKPSSALWNI